MGYGSKTTVFDGLRCAESKGRKRSLSCLPLRTLYKNCATALKADVLAKLYSKNKSHSQFYNCLWTDEKKDGFHHPLRKCRLKCEKLSTFRRFSTSAQEIGCRKLNFLNLRQPLDLFFSSNGRSFHYSNCSSMGVRTDAIMT